MIFNSLTFLVFFAIVLALHYAPFFSWHQKKVNLMIASYLFYAAWNPPFVILLWVSTVVDWWAAQWMVRAKREHLTFNVITKPWNPDTLRSQVQLAVTLHGLHAKLEGMKNQMR